MSTLVLIRHGQASFGAENYDVLSELGAAQSAALGRHCAERDEHFDAIYVGPLERQRDTVDHMLDGARSAGKQYPDPIELDDLTEYPAFELFKYWMPILRAEDPEVAALLAAPHGRETFDRIYERCLIKWATGELETGELESFAQFDARVTRGLRHIMDTQGRKKRVAVVTSGGPISIAMKLALGLADERTLRVAWVIANASRTEFRYRGDELTMVGFNAIHHFEDESLITYR